MDSVKYVQGIFSGNTDIHAYVEYVKNEVTCIDTNLETGCDILCFRGGVGSYCGKKKQKEHSLIREVGVSASSGYTTSI